MRGIEAGYYLVVADWNFYKINIERLENMHQQELKNKGNEKYMPTQELPF